MSFAPRHPTRTGQVEHLLPLQNSRTTLAKADSKFEDSNSFLLNTSLEATSSASGERLGFAFSQIPFNSLKKILIVVGPTLPKNQAGLILC